MGHMAVSWATIQVLAAVPSVPEGETKKPPVSPSLRSLFFLLFPVLSLFLVCKQSLTSSCTHLTPNPSDKAHSAVRATSRGSRYREIVHHNGLCLLPAFSKLCPPSCVSSHTSLMPPPLPFFVWTEPGNIYFALVVVNKLERVVCKSRVGLI